MSAYLGRQLGAHRAPRLAHTSATVRRRCMPCRTPSTGSDISRLRCRAAADGMAGLRPPSSFADDFANFKETLPADLVAGVSVGCVAIPSALAYSVLAGVPLESGLVASAVGPISAAFLTNSRYLQTGPVALTCFLTLEALTALHLVPGTAAYAANACTLALLVGAFRLMMGASRVGGLYTLIQRSVLDGFTLASAWLIVFTQLPAILGFAPIVSPGQGLPIAAFHALVQPASWQLAPMLVAAATIAVVSFRPHRLWPGALVAAALGCGASALGLPVGETVGVIEHGDLYLHAPTLSHLQALLWPGLAIAVAGFTDSAAIGRRFAEEDGERWDAGRELTAQGAANMACGLFGGLPVGASFTRTSLNRVVGCKSRVAGAVTGLTVLLFLHLNGTHLLSHLPKAVLGGMVIAAVLPLLRPLRGMSAAGWLTAAVSVAVCPHLELSLAFGFVAAFTSSAFRRFMVAGSSLAGAAGGREPAGRRKGGGEGGGRRPGAAKERGGKRAARGGGGEREKPKRDKSGGDRDEEQEDYFSRRYSNDVR